MLDRTGGTRSFGNFSAVEPLATKRGGEDITEPKPGEQLMSRRKVNKEETVGDE